MTIFSVILCIYLILCAISVSLTKYILSSIMIYMSFSVVMCVIWILLESPDLAITEAAVGAGVTTLLFFATFKKIHLIDDVIERESDDED